jgi:hypothetical protein
LRALLLITGMVSLVAKSFVDLLEFRSLEQPLALFRHRD